MAFLFKRWCSDSLLKYGCKIFFKTCNSKSVHFISKHRVLQKVDQNISTLAAGAGCGQRCWKHTRACLWYVILISENVLRTPQTRACVGIIGFMGAVGHAFKEFPFFHLGSMCTLGLSATAIGSFKIYLFPPFFCLF